MWNSKPKKKGHSCSKKSKGRPKIGNGICYTFRPRPTVKERMESKHIINDALDEMEQDE